MLSIKEIQERLNSEHPLEINNYKEENKTFGGFDLRVGSDYKNPETGEVYDANTNHSNQIVLEPNTHYHMHTIESLNIPNNMYGRTDIIMEKEVKGIRVGTGIIDPTHRGKLLLSVKNVTNTMRSIEPGDRIVRLSLYDKPNSEEPHDKESKDRTYHEQHFPNK